MITTSDGTKYPLRSFGFKDREVWLAKVGGLPCVVPSDMASKEQTTAPLFSLLRYSSISSSAHAAGISTHASPATTQPAGPPVTSDDLAQVQEKSSVGGSMVWWSAGKLAVGGAKEGPPTPPVRGGFGRILSLWQRSLCVSATTDGGLLTTDPALTPSTDTLH